MYSSLKLISVCIIHPTEPSVTVELTSSVFLNFTLFIGASLSEPHTFGSFIHWSHGYLQKHPNYFHIWTTACVYVLKVLTQLTHLSFFLCKFLAIENKSQLIMIYFPYLLIFFFVYEALQHKGWRSAGH